MEITKQEYNLLHQLLSMRESSLLKSLPKVLKKYYKQENVHSTKDYIYAVGEIPVALIAHLDTIHNTPPRTIYHDPMEGVLWSLEGLGADDRAGVFSILQILEKGYRPSIIFTSGEELGGIGAHKFIKDFPNPLTEILFLIELDRQGYNEAVYYDCGNRDFEDFISSFGFTTNIGSFSDILIIGPVWDRASVNLSIGYINEHTIAETLFYKDMFVTIEKVETILNNCGNVLFDYQKNNTDICDYCAKILRDKEALKIRYGDEDFYLCGECVENHVSVCRCCGRKFIDPYLMQEVKVCEDCENAEEFYKYY